MAIVVLSTNPVRWALWSIARSLRSVFRATPTRSLTTMPVTDCCVLRRWTLRGLLKQMDRHFAERTANVQKKFELEEWPEK